MWSFPPVNKVKSCFLFSSQILFQLHHHPLLLHSSGEADIWRGRRLFNSNSNISLHSSPETSGWSGSLMYLVVVVVLQTNSYLSYHLLHRDSRELLPDSQGSWRTGTGSSEYSGNIKKQSSKYLDMLVVCLFLMSTTY